MEDTRIAADAVRWVALGYSPEKAFELGKLIHGIGENVLDHVYKAAIEQNPKLAECTAESLIGALLAMSNLDLGLEHVVLDPVQDGISGEIKCFFRLGYKGYLELSRHCYRSDEQEGQKVAS
jgi:recombinational DNA repair protein RecT